jgi:hypothetical protein
MNLLWRYIFVGVCLVGCSSNFRLMHSDVPIAKYREELKVRPTTPEDFFSKFDFILNDTVKNYLRTIDRDVAVKELSENFHAYYARDWGMADTYGEGWNPLSKYFNGYGIFNREIMARILFASYYNHVNGLSIPIETTIGDYKKMWKNFYNHSNTAPRNPRSRNPGLTDDKITAHEDSLLSLKKVMQLNTGDTLKANVFTAVGNPTTTKPRQFFISAILIDKDTLQGRAKLEIVALKSDKPSREQMWEVENEKRVVGSIFWDRIVPWRTLTERRFCWECTVNLK